MKLFTMKEIFEDIKDAVDTAEHYMHSTEDQFDGLSQIFEKVEEMQKHYDLYEAKDMNYKMETIKEMAEYREITDFEDMLDDDFGNLTSEQMSEKTNFFRQSYLDNHSHRMFYYAQERGDCIWEVKAWRVDPAPYSLQQSKRRIEPSLLN